MRNVRCNRLVMLALLIFAVSISSFGGVFISVGIAPPPLPVYVQPVCPAPGYIWTPGYWAYGPDGYFWVPGTWVMAPEVGLLWTPGYWGWGGSAFIWNGGYWGPTVGFYGGVNYGFGYTGIGYQGGYWRGNDFYYNRSVNQVNVTNIHNVYNTTVVNNTTVNRVSYNGGNGGITARPTAAQQAAAQQRHIAPTSVQTQHEQMASTDHAQLASVNHGRPEVAATPKPAAFHGAGVVRASNAPVTNIPAVRPAQPNNGNANASRPASNNVSHSPERANASTGATHPSTANNASRPANSNVPHPPEHANASTGATHSSTANNVPRPPARTNQTEMSPQSSRAANTPTHNNTAAHPPANESAPRPQNAAAPHPEFHRHTVRRPRPADRRPNLRCTRTSRPRM